jgi:glycosyltransferase involved in cell wall biosynthesis
VTHPLGGILRSAYRDNTSLNCLTFATHERAAWPFSLSKHQFYLWWSEGIKQWNPAFGKLPKNFHVLNKQGLHQLPPNIEFDVIISQSKAGQYPVAVDLARRYNLPHIVMEHTEPLPQWKNMLPRYKEMRGDLDIFITAYSRAAWGFQENEALVIEHAIDAELFKPKYEWGQRNIHLLKVANDFINRDVFLGYSLWKETVEGLPIKLLGDTPNLSKAAGSLDELADAYASSVAYINTSLHSPIPMAVLEAMSSACVVISTATSALPDIINNGVNGFITNDKAKLRQLCKDVLAHPEDYEEIGKNARKTILERFNSKRFLEQWDAAFAAALHKKSRN